MVRSYSEELAWEIFISICAIYVRSHFYSYKSSSFERYARPSLLLADPIDLPLFAAACRVGLNHFNAIPSLFNTIGCT
jgi:hypothetical protein